LREAVAVYDLANLAINSTIIIGAGAAGLAGRSI